jgi:hypothetical protein
MKLDLNIHVNSWLSMRNEAIIPDQIMIQFKNNHQKMIVDTSEKIRIKFEYPLSHSVVLEFGNAKRPWRLEDLLDCVAEGYVKIYDEEDETRTLPAQAPLDSILVNRPQTDGKYGIWGHILNDLYIEGMYKDLNGIWRLDIGS